jgi:hypothetical protein
MDYLQTRIYDTAGLKLRDYVLEPVQPSTNVYPIFV